MCTTVSSYSCSMSALPTHTQFIRFAIVGALSNGLLFLFYLGLTSMGVGHKLAMSVLYAAGVMQTFFFNKKWTFRHDGETRRALLRYWLAYGIGYVLNLAVLIILVDWAGFPHQVVQGVMIVVLAILLFLLQKFWVFAPSPSKYSSV